ncbi:MAG: hypothetical protein FJ222_03220 [Lentisphaerae bacterium]|nr:hypothetical protein [Lentisphaerota bacterium]
MKADDPIMKPVFFMCAALAVRCWADTAGTVRESPTPRLPGGRLHLSLQQEADAAVRRGGLWLRAGQQPGGYWGVSNRLATAYAVLALRQMPADTNLQAAVDRGQAWLRRTSDSGTNTFWTALATGAEITPWPSSGTVDAARPLTLDIVQSSLLSGDRVLLITEINRAIPVGLVVTPADWREQLAGTLVARQQHDPQTPGAGFWLATGMTHEAAAEAQTALAMLILLQL